MASILYIDDEDAVGEILEDALVPGGHQVVGTRGVPEALKLVERGGVDLIISDYRMPGITGLEFLSILARDGSDIPVMMLTNHASVEHAVASIKAGAIDYICLPVRAEQLRLAVDQALEFVRIRRDNDVLRREVIELRCRRQIIGDSPAVRRVLQTVAMAAPTRATVLLEGESGTGKELFARALHDQSDRRDKPFIQINCAALPEGLIESALFGHERGAFTGAMKRVEGAFERAHRGTLLLDEVSEMRLDLQAKLLRVLQEQEFDRVGGTTPVRVDVRVIATSNRDLAAEVELGTFRRDLFYRLGVIPIRIPPLRERKEDIAILAHRFAVRMGAELGRQVEGLSPTAVTLLQAQEWPGNVRELQHAVERAVILSSEPMIPAHAFDAARHGLTPSGGTLRVPEEAMEGSLVDSGGDSNAPERLWADLALPDMELLHPGGFDGVTFDDGVTAAPSRDAGENDAGAGVFAFPEEEPRDDTFPVMTLSSAEDSESDGAEEDAPAVSSPAVAPRESAGVLLTTFSVAEAERRLIAGALEAARGNRTRAASLLGISVRTLRNKLNTPPHGIAVRGT